jgi:hypothetical protein
MTPRLLADKILLIRAGRFATGPGFLRPLETLPDTGFAPSS